MVFYVYVLFIVSCDSDINPDGICQLPCYYSDPVLGLWETTVHGIFATVSILVFSGTLMIRVYRSKSRLRQPMNWRKHRKMMFQLISLSSLHLSITSPYYIYYIVDAVVHSDWSQQVWDFFSFLFYLIPLLFPFMCLAYLPDIWTDIKRITHRRQNQRIRPIS